MKRSKLGWFFSILGLLALIALVWIVGPLLSIAGREPLASDFNRLLVILVIVVLWLLNILRQHLKASNANKELAEGIAEAPAQEPAQVAPGEGRSREEIAQLRERFDEALLILKKMRGQGGGNLYELPWYIIIGPPGSGKTTALVNSGLNFPLGDRFGKESIQGFGGTRNCDWWFTDDAVLLDTAGRYVTQESDKAVDTAAWDGFLRLLKTHRRRRPINGVLVAISLSDLVLQSEQQRNAHVRAIKQRIQELYNFFHVRFPVYVLFTKCDLVAGFTEFFDDLGREDRAQAWGTTFPLEEEGNVERFGSEFDALLERLNDRLVSRMEQERDVRRRGLVYGFPQQMASLKETVDGFLQDIFRATRFDEQPLVRGVYFTSGTQEGTPIDRMMGAVARSFGLGQQVIASPSGQGRSYFITNLLKHVIFQEAELVGTNRRVERQRTWLQRGAYAAAFAATAGAVVAWSASYTRNLDYVGRMQEQVGAYNQMAEKDLPAGAGFDDVLPPLESLYTTTQVYEEFADDVPWHMQLGMYQGRKLGRAAQDAYLRELRRAFLPLVAGRVATHLASGNDDPDFQFTALKTYLMLGDLDHLDPELLKLWMSLDWQRTYASDARKQDQLMAHLDALLAGGLEPMPLDENLIERARRRLTQVPLHELVYGRLKRDSEAVEKNPFRVSDVIGSAGQRVFTRKSGESLDEAIPELFTYRGYYEIYQKDSRLLVAKIRDESWVLDTGRDDFGQQELQQLDVNLGKLYAREYVRRWKGILDDLRIVRFRSVDHGVEVLETLSGRRTPMRALLQAVARNTSLTVLPEGLGGAAKVAEKAGALGSTTERLKRLLAGSDEGAGQEELSPAMMVEQQFEDLNQLVGAKEGDPPLDDLIDLLAKVYSHLDAVTVGEEGNPSVLRRLKSEALGQPQPVKTWLRQLVDAGEVATGQKRAADEAKELKEKREEIVKAMNGAWEARVLPMCRKALEGRYPIHRDGEREMTVKDFGQLFGDGGLVDKFFAEHLRPFVDTSKTPWSWREVDDMSLGLSNAVLDQFQLASQIRDAFFQSGGTNPAVEFDLKPTYLADQVTQFRLDLEGQTFLYRHGPARAKGARWPNPDGPREVRMVFSDKDGQQFTRKKEGPWAWFRLLDDARIERETADRLIATFEADGREARYEIIANSVINPFLMEELQKFRCPQSF